jgi:O-antigen/teichoic acid export membrane protein
MTKNIIANLAGRLWAFASIFIFVPVYIKLLGIEAFGVITFYSVLLMLLTFAEAGLTATLNREFARQVDDPRYKADLLRTFEYIYLGFALLIVCAVFLFAGSIADAFLKSQTIPREELIRDVRIMGLTIGIGIFPSLYQGGLMGLQRQVLSNAIGIGHNAVRAGLVVVPLLFFPTLQTYFYWQLACTILYCAILRSVIGKQIDSAGARANPAFLKQLWRYTAGVIGMAVIHAVNTQVDKLSVGNILSLTDFSYYNLSSQFAQMGFVLCSPLALAFFPELTRRISISDENSMHTLCRRFAFLTATLTAAATLVLITYAEPYIAIWQQDAAIARIVGPVARILLVSYFFMALQLIPYYIALAHGHTRTNVIIGIVSIALIVPGIYCFANRYGLIGAAIPWMGVNLLTTFLLWAIIFRRYLPGKFLPWMTADVLLPSVVTPAVGIPLIMLFRLLPQNYYTIVYGVAVFAVCCTVNGLIFLRRNPELNIKPLIIRK